MHADAARAAGPAAERRLSRSNPLPRGTAPVAAGLAVSGLTAYGFLAIAARALGPKAYAPVSVLWTLVFIAVPGLFLPLEQEVGRAISARRVAGVGGRSVVLRAAAAGGVVALLVAGASAAAGSAFTAHLFDGQSALLAGFVISVVVYVLYYLTRGVLAGGGAFAAYGVLLTAEGLARVVFVVVLALAGVHTAGLYGLAVGLPVLIGVGAALLMPAGEGFEKGPPAHWAEISHAVVFLVAGSLLGQILVNAGPLAVKILAGPREQAVAGTFLNGSVIARIPLFFFQAIQAALLPALAAHAAAGRLYEFRHGLRRLMLGVAAIAALAVVGSALSGPFVVSHFFGSGFQLSHVDMGLLAAASGIYMVALGMVQGVIALSGHRLVPLGWLIGVVGFLIALAILGTARSVQLTLRVELALVTGSLLSLMAVALMLERRLRAAHAASGG